MSLLKKLYFNEIAIKLKDAKYKNPMMVPRITKIVINRGLGEATANSKVIDVAVEQLAAISAQKPIITKAKKSISNFKLREGQAIGCKVTLRDEKMYDFLTKFINIVLPKIRDFKGVSSTSFDGDGNYSLGIKEETMFPEVDIDKIDKTRGLQITIATTAKTDEDAKELLTLMGMPFRKKAN